MEIATFCFMPDSPIGVASHNAPGRQENLLHRPLFDTSQFVDQQWPCTLIVKHGLWSRLQHLTGSAKTLQYKTTAECNSLTKAVVGENVVFWVVLQVKLCLLKMSGTFTGIQCSIILLAQLSQYHEFVYLNQTILEANISFPRNVRFLYLQSADQ